MPGSQDGQRGRYEPVALAADVGEQVGVAPAGALLRTLVGRVQSNRKYAPSHVAYDQHVVAGRGGHDPNG